MKKLLLLAALLLAVLTAGAQTQVLPRSSCADEGVDPVAVSRWVDSMMAIPETEVHHLMVLRHDKVIAECHPAPFRAEYTHTLYSCSKTVTALAIGCLIDDNRLRLDDRVAALLPEYMPDTISDKLAQVTVRHLLTMATGITPELAIYARQDDWLTHYYSGEVDELGRFLYDSMCTYTLGVIVEKLSGMSLLDFVKQRFFNPMGITVTDWELSPGGHNTAGFGLRLQAESMAKIGLLILHGGQWNGRQLVSTEWIDQMTTAHINYKNPSPTPSDTNQGYCYQMWRCLIPGAFRADGAYGQFIIISPEHDMVVVVNGYSARTAAELRLVREVLVPGVTDAAPDKRIRRAEQEMTRRLAAQSLPLPAGTATSRRSADVLDRTVAFAENGRGYRDVLATQVDKNTIRLTVTNSRGEQLSYNLTARRWSDPQPAVVPPYHNGAAPADRPRIDGLPQGGGDFLVSGSYAWRPDGTLHCRLQWLNWITAQDITITSGVATLAETP